MRTAAGVGDTSRCARLWLRIRRAGTQPGASLLEFALAAALLLSVVFGLLIMSLALYSYHYVSDAAREAVRYAMVRGSSCPAYGNLSADCPLGSSTALQTYVRNLGFPGIDPSNLTVTTTWSANGATWSSSPATVNAPGDYVKVVVSYRLPVQIPFVSSQSLTLNSTAETVISD